MPTTCHCAGGQSPKSRANTRKFHRPANTRLGLRAVLSSACDRTSRNRYDTSHDQCFRGTDTPGAASDGRGAGVSLRSCTLVRGADRSAGAGDGTGNRAVSAKDVLKLAEDLAAKDFERPTVEVPEPFNALKAEQYRDIRFRNEQALWQSERIGVEVHLLPRGWIYETPVDIRVVEDGQARRLIADSRMFTFGEAIPSAPEAAPYAFSGFRMVGPLSRADRVDEFAVFQGASYFRAVGLGQTYGLSARGLAVNTAQPAGEEFPIFRAFWIEKPRIPGAEIVVHALLDSPSVTGAYRFTIGQGEATEMLVDAVLYPRRSLKHVGLAPLTSMFLRGSAQRRVNGDLRPAVHNSEGLSILNGRGERIWRPLTNPRTLQTSAFIDKGPRGFGLIQRDRAFDTFDDLSAHFERRPSLWVEPRATGATVSWN